MSWRIAENKWNIESAPWTRAIGIEYADEENLLLHVPGVVCWLTRGGDAEGNARKIAAAPDLLAALESIVRKASISANNLAAPAIHQANLAECYLIARTALAKMIK